MPLTITSPITFDPLVPSILHLCRRSSCSSLLLHCTRSSSSSSSSKSRWLQRQGQDAFARDAKVQGLKSRAAFKLLEIDAKHAIFRSGQTVVDLGYAPGSWSQVALQRTRPNGRVIGIDLIPARPPRGVATFQGDFLSPRVQQMVKTFIIQSHFNQSHSEHQKETFGNEEDPPTSEHIDQPSYIDIERRSGTSPHYPSPIDDNSTARLVDVVLSDMLMNTSGIGFRDHVGSMSLCYAALDFASDTLKAGGHLICKFYQGSEDKLLERKLKMLFRKVHREKPESSRNESKEAYFIALRRRANVDINVPGEDSASMGSPVKSW